MKKSMLYVFSLMICLGLVASSHAFASQSSRINLSEDFDSLDGNEAVVQKARLVDPNNRVSIVQKRKVDLNDRLELGVGYGIVAGGETYYTTQDLGATLDFHFNPHWSIGGRYYHSLNSLNSEGQAVYNNAGNEGSYYVPQLSYPTDQGLAVVNWYPIYGKLNFFDAGIAHFDVYGVAGYGKIFLQTAGATNGLNPSTLGAVSSYSSDTYTAGLGVGIWWNQLFTTRVEGRYQTYQEQYYTGANQVNAFVITASIGILL